MNCSHKYLLPNLMLVKCMYLINLYYYRKIKTNTWDNNLESKLQSLCKCNVSDKFPERFRINHCCFICAVFHVC